MSAACAGFPAKMRETSIRVCLAHLDLTAKVAVEAYNAATVTANDTTSSSRCLKPSPSTTSMSSHLSNGQSTVSKEEEKEAKEANADQTRDLTADASSGSRDRSSCARGAVVRAACLVAAQGLMDPASGPRLAGESLARSALSLWSSPPALVEEGHEWSWDKEDGGAIVEGDYGTSANVDGKAPFHATDEGESAKTHTDRMTTRVYDEGVGGTNLGGERKRETRTDSAPTRSTQEGTSTCAGRGVAGGTPPSETAASTNNSLVPLRDLRWGVEMILACVAPYLADGIPVAYEDVAGKEPIASEDGRAHARGTVDGSNSSHRRRSASTHMGGRERSGSTKLERKWSRGASLGGVGNSSGDQWPHDNAEGEEEGQQPDARFDPAPEKERDGSIEDATCGSQVGLRLLAFACRHPDIGPALVSSVLASWIPSLAQRSRPRPVAKAITCIEGSGHRRGIRRSGPYGGDTNAMTAEQPVSFSGPQKPKERLDVSLDATAPVGEVAASEALVSGAIHMLCFMLRSFPLLPLSDFSTETLVAVAEGGMAFGECTRSTNTGTHVRRGGSEIPRCTGAAVAAAARAGADHQHHNRRRHRGGQRSSKCGRAQKAGEALMVELLLSASDCGGARSGLGEFLPSLNTARGIMFMHDTSSALHAQSTSRAKGAAFTSGDGSERGSFGEGGNSEVLPGRIGNRKRRSSDTAPGRAAAPWRSRGQPIVAEVEVRQRVELPPPPVQPTPTVPDSGPLATNTEKHDLKKTAKKTTGSTLEQDKTGDVSHLARHDMTREVHSRTSESSSWSHGVSSSSSSFATARALSKEEKGTSVRGQGGEDDSLGASSSALLTAPEEHREEDNTTLDATTALDSQEQDIIASAPAGMTRVKTMTGKPKANRVSPLPSFGSKKSRSSLKDPKRTGTEVISPVQKPIAEVGVASAQAEGDAAVAASADEERKLGEASRDSKGGSGFLSRMFRRGKK